MDVSGSIVHFQCLYLDWGLLCLPIIVYRGNNVEWYLCPDYIIEGLIFMKKFNEANGTTVYIVHL